MQINVCCIGLDSEIADTTGTSISCGIEKEKCVIEEESEGTASAKNLRAMAATIQSAKTVPPKDFVTKRKRDSEKTENILCQSSKDVSTLVVFLNKALEKFQPSLQSVSRSSRFNVSPDVEVMLGTVTVALNKVHEEEQVSCIMDILAVIKGYIKQH